MADFVAVLKKTLDGMGQTTPESRQRVYEKARQTISAKLAAIDPPPPASVADRQRRALEDAIRTVEKDYVAKSDPLAELEDVFASLKNPQPKPLERPVAKTGARPMTTPTTAPPPPRPAPTMPRAATRTAPVSSGPAAVSPDARQATAAPPPVREPAPAREAPQTSHPAPANGPEFDDDGPAEFSLRRPERRKRSYGPLLVAAVLLAVIAGGGYGVWLNRAAFGDMLGLGNGSQTAEVVPPEPAPPEEPAADETAEPESSEPSKFTQRLTPEGTEVDPGPANGGASVGEGTSVAGLTQAPGIDPPMSAPPDEEAAPGNAEQNTPAPNADPAVAVAQKAIFYEERTSASEGSAEPGTTVWTLVQESPGANLPPEPAIRAEATIPGRDLKMRLTIRRNADQSLPASHILEMIFLVPEGFPGGGVENILRVAMKGSEQEAGNPLIGIPAKIADGFFLVALNDSPAEIDANLTLLRRQSWIDIPVVYKSGRRALFTMEKGVPGDQVFDEALKAWAAASASAPG